MPTWLSTLLFVVLVTAVVLLAMVMFEVDLFTSIGTFAWCLLYAFCLACLVVGGFSWLFGLPKITRNY